MFVGECGSGGGGNWYVIDSGGGWNAYGVGGMADFCTRAASIACCICMSWFTVVARFCTRSFVTFSCSTMMSYLEGD